MVFWMAAAVAANAAASWYGPVRVAFDSRFEGNPYDFESNDVRVSLKKGGQETSRLAYFEDGKWVCNVLVSSPGEYQASLVRNGQPVAGTVKSVSVPASLKSSLAFVKVSRQDGTRFELDSGQPFFPLGTNLAWTNNEVPDLPAAMKRMAQAGMNWARVWACHWDGKNPYWPSDSAIKLRIGEELWPPALEKWDSVVSAAEKTGVRVQFVLFHHGQVSSTVNPNWGEHPWYVRNGGFLQRAADFFTDDRAKRLAKQWLRYAVARWGHSPSIFAWELFNEVEWSDLALSGRWDLVSTWHREMSEYLRGIDPYRHLIATSSHMGHPDLWKPMDFYNPHGYPPNVRGMVAGAVVPKDKPFFFGEFGGDGPPGEGERLIVRDGVWSGILSGHSGAAMYWYWDRMDRYGLFDEYERASKVLNQTRFAYRTDLKPLATTVRTDRRGALSIGFGRGWEKSEKFDFSLPGEATPAHLGKASSYLQSLNGPHQDMGGQPFRFILDAPAGGKVRATFSELSATGAAIQILVNGNLAAMRKYAAEPGRRPTLEPLEATFERGRSVIEIRSVGPDWIKLRSLEFEGVGPAAQAMAIGSKDFALVRLDAVPGSQLPIRVSLERLGLADGAYAARETDLATGAQRALTLRVQGGRFVEPFLLERRDVVLSLEGGRARR